MQVEAIYEQGHLEFSHPMQFKHKRVRLMVEIPDDEVVNTANPYNLSPEVLSLAQAMVDKYSAIRNAPLPPDDELTALTPKQLERIEAFALREDR